MFRKARFSDGAMLWKWRQASEREGIDGGWYEGWATTLHSHIQWFRQNHRRIRVWLEDGSPSGMVRVDSNGEIAFYVPLELRGSGIERRMLTATHSLASQFGGRLKATVDEGNTWAWQALKEAGFREYPVRFLAYKP